MKKYTLMKICIVVFIFSCIFLIGIFEIIKYNETGLCFNTDKKLTDNEMRIKTIKNLILLQIKSNKWHASYGTKAKIILINKSLTESEIIESIKSSSLLAFTKSNVFNIDKQEDISSIPTNIFQDKFTLINYSTQANWFLIFPGDEIKKANTQELNSFLSSRKKFKYNFYERIFGFGNYLYKIKLYTPNPACCDDDIHPLSKNWYIEDNLKTIDFISKELGSTYLAISNCGDIMVRYYDDHDDGHAFYRF